MNHAFTFRHAAAIVPYLAALGISHLYASPILKARPGSMHGYDTVDFSALNPELGSRADFDALVATLHDHCMGLIVDVVANHMGILANENSWWMDVLENGPAAIHAKYFDIDWFPPRSSMHNRLLVPVLGEPFGQALEKGNLRVDYDASDAAFSVRYFEHRFPIDPREYPRLFAGHQVALAAALHDDEQARQDFESLVDAFGRLPSRTDASGNAPLERYRDKEVCRRRLARLCERIPQLVAFIESCVRLMNGTPGDTPSFEPLAQLLEAQAYRLAYWRVAGDEINYRRFFDINELAALRVDDADVFAATHALIFELIGSGHIDGLRIDHPDGLFDPQQYFERLQAPFSTPESDPRGPLYVVAEKILASHERLSSSWPVQGTTGYEFAGLVNTWLVDSGSEEVLSRTYNSFTGRQWNLDAIALDSKKLVMKVGLAAEVAVLTTQLDRIAQLDRHTADFTRFALRDAIIDTIACFPVYRTYMSTRGISEDDRHAVDWAINVARKASQAADTSAFDFLRGVLLGDAAAGRPPAHRLAMLEFSFKFQQVTAPVMAKGVEDTSFYIFNRLTSLNEVGGDPRRFGLSTSALHRSNGDRARAWPHAMLTTSTHDTKRSEDARARIAALTQCPELWRRHLSRWNRINRSKRREVDGTTAPSRNDEYLLYQTLLALWPANGEAVPADLPGRLIGYATKAAREAKVSSSWVNPNMDYEAALVAFIEHLLATGPNNSFLHDFREFARPVAYFGSLNSLSQVLLKLTSPGVPDLYQGTEVTALQVVDPDNRIAVDYGALHAMLEELRGRSADSAALPGLLAELQQHWEDGRSKLYLTWQALRLRAREPLLFADGGYEPLRVTGQWSEHLCAYVRTLETKRVLVVVTRNVSRVVASELRPPVGQECWGNTRIELLPSALDTSFQDVLSGQIVPVDRGEHGSWISAGAILQHFPVALAIAWPASIR